MLKVNKTKSSGENVFNGDHIGTQGNHKSSQDEETLFMILLQICDRRFNR